jgi:CheY-like chemotaxis protein
MEAAKPRILCLDDQLESLQIRKFLLEQFGCDVVTVTDSCVCLQLVVQESFDLVLLDYHLAEEVTGADVARDIAVLFPNLPLVMLTGDAKVPGSARECVDEVLIKGASGPGDLLDTIERLLPGSRIKPRRERSLPRPVPASRIG